jgi:hypothetical protein
MPAFVSAAERLNDAVPDKQPDAAMVAVLCVLVLACTVIP